MTSALDSAWSLHKPNNSTGLAAVQIKSHYKGWGKSISKVNAVLVKAISSPDNPGKSELHSLSNKSNSKYVAQLSLGTRKYKNEYKTFQS